MLSFDKMMASGRKGVVNRGFDWDQSGAGLAIKNPPKKTRPIKPKKTRLKKPKKTHLEVGFIGFF
jgi:hypothetical protein